MRSEWVSKLSIPMRPEVSIGGEEQGNITHISLEDFIRSTRIVFSQCMVDWEYELDYSDTAVFSRMHLVHSCKGPLFSTCRHEESDNVSLLNISTCSPEFRCELEVWS